MWLIAVDSRRPTLYRIGMPTLDWIEKKAVLNHHRQVPYHLLRCDREVSAGEVRFPDLAAHVFFTETGSPIPARASGKTPLLGVHQDKAVYLLFNGVLGDKRPAGAEVFGALRHHVPADSL